MTHSLSLGQANMAWACAVFGSYPRELMQYLYVGLMGTGKEQNPAYMSSLHGDGGLQLQVTKMTSFLDRL